MPYIIPLFIHFRHTPGVPMSENPNAHWGTGASVRVEFRDRSCAYGSLPDAPDSIAGRGKAKPLWLHRSEDVEREEWRYAWRVPLALPPAQKEGGWYKLWGLHRCGIAIPGPFGPPIAPRSRNRLAFETAGGASPVSPVLLPEAKEEFLILFRRACTCRKFPDSDALGGVHQSAD